MYGLKARTSSRVQPLRRSRLSFSRRIPGLKSETRGTLGVSKVEFFGFPTAPDIAGLGWRRASIMRLWAAFTLAIVPAALAQTPSAGSPTLTSRSTLVRVPALVRDKADRLVYSLREKDFVLTDDGAPQKLHLEEDTGGEPIALVIDIEDGGAGARELAKYTGLASMAGSIAGGVPHEVAIVGFDSSPVLVGTSRLTRMQPATPCRRSLPRKAGTVGPPS